MTATPNRVHRVHRAHRRYRHGRLRIGHPLLHEQLERRLLLTSFVVNGTSGNDQWTVGTSGGFIFVNNLGYPEAGYSDIVVNGLAGNDFLDLGETDLPVTFNGGNNDDSISNQPRDDLSFNHQPITFNGGSGYDQADLIDASYATNTTYTIFQNQVTRTGFGGLVVSSDVDKIIVQTGNADMAVYVQAMTVPAAVEISGQSTANESVYLDMNGGTGAFDYFGNGGEGDSLLVDDYGYTGGVGYNITDSQVYHPSLVLTRVVGYAGCRSLTLQGSGTNANTYHVFRTAAGCATGIIGGSAGDSFIVDGGNGAVDNIHSPLTILGGGGSDSLSYSYATYTGPVDTFYLTPTQLYRSGGFATTYDSIENLTLTGPNNNSNYQITGTSAQITGQTTLLAGSGNNFINVFNRDAAGNPTIPTNLGISGGGGTSDIVDISSGPSALPDNYVLSNPFGPSTADISGVGAGLVGAASDVEVIAVEGGDGDDTFRLDSFKSGNGLWAKGNGGDDTFDLTPLSGNLAANLTSISSFLFSGGTGSDALRVHNDNSPSAWTYTRGIGFLIAQTSSYAVNLGEEQTETIFASGGTLADTFNINATEAGTATVIDGGQDFDHVTVQAPGVRFASPQRLADLTINQTGTVAVDSGGSNTVVARVLAIADNGQLDLADNDLVDDYVAPNSPIAAVTNYVQSGRNGGTWDGDGIVSSSAGGNFTTLGVAEASQALGISGTQTAAFAGETVDATAVLVKYTYGGDANLDGKINVDDYGRIDSSIPLGIAGWYNGDLNYDGKINVDDYGIIDSNIGIQGPPLGGVADPAASVTFGHATRLIDDPSGEHRAMDLLDAGLS